MLTINRIKEAEYNFNKYLHEGLLLKSQNDVAKQVFFKNASDSLKAAQLLFNNNYSLWTIVTAYYSMFYITNAVLLKLGYKTSHRIVHKVTADALIHIIRPKLKSQILLSYEDIKDQAMQIAKIKSDQLISNFDYERNKRNAIQYQTSKADLKQKANTSLTRAKEFVFEMEQLLNE